MYFFSLSRSSKKKLRVIYRLWGCGSGEEYPVSSGLLSRMLSLDSEGSNPNQDQGQGSNSNQGQGSNSNQDQGGKGRFDYLQPSSLYPTIASAPLTASRELVDVETQTTLSRFYDSAGSRGTHYSSASEGQSLPITEEEALPFRQVNNIYRTCIYEKEPPVDIGNPIPTPLMARFLIKPRLADFERYVRDNWKTGNHSVGASIYVPLTNKVTNNLGVSLFVGSNSKGFQTSAMLTFEPRKLFLVSPAYRHKNMQVNGIPFHLNAQTVYFISQIPRNVRPAYTGPRDFSRLRAGSLSRDVAGSRTTLFPLSAAGFNTDSELLNVARSTPIQNTVALAPSRIPIETLPLTGASAPSRIPIETLPLLIPLTLGILGTTFARSGSRMVREIVNIRDGLKDDRKKRSFLEIFLSPPSGGGGEPHPGRILSDHLLGRRIRSLRWYILVVFLFISLLIGIDLWFNKGATINNLINLIRGVEVSKPDIGLTIFEPSIQDKIMSFFNRLVHLFLGILCLVVLIISIDPMVRLLALLISALRAQRNKTLMGNVIDINSDSRSLK